jgi:DnaJ-class molecular chaperone
MAQAYKLYKICDKCSGTGTCVVEVETEITTIPCPNCKGLKVILYGYCSVNTYDVSEVPE